MRSLRRWVSDRLLAAGATTAIDCEQMWRKAQRSGVRNLGNGDLRVLFMLDLVSNAKIWLGMRIMPAGLPGSLTDSTSVK
jgi:hypothetical protein